MSKYRSDTLKFKESFGKTHLFGKTALVLSSWFGVGLIPVAPGTCGTLAAVPLFFCMKYIGILYSVIFLIVFIPMAVWVSGISKRLLGRDDPPEVVIDEVAGFMLALFLLPLTWSSLTLGFLLFRIFDILKPLPIGRLEKIRGGIGIVVDDLVAGVYANFCVRIFLSVLFFMTN
jgi:phosphatidylglycerophosphatase A